MTKLSVKPILATIFAVFIFTTSSHAIEFAAHPKTGKATTKVLFDFHSGFWINLHHFLYYQALLRNTVNGPNKPKLTDTSALDILSPTQRQVWQTAINYYENNLVSRDLLLDSAMEKIKNALEDKENELMLNGPGLPDVLDAVLNGVSGSYRTIFWEKQNQNNQLWISKVQPLIQKYGDTLSAELGKIYLTPWPKEPVRVDVTNYASWSGAYTTLYPNRITTSSVDSSNQQVAALEIVFHEASHILIGNIIEDISKICKQDNKLLPRRDLWHAILFYTTGEIIRQHFKNYTPYAYKNGLWERAWPMYINYLAKDWQPYIKGEMPFDTALAQLVKDVEISK